MTARLNRIAGRTAMQLRLIFHGHIANPFWHSRIERRKQRYKATRAAVMHYLQRYAPAVSRVTPEPVATAPEPERAFTIWFQGEDRAPELVKACFRSMRRHLRQELVVLDEHTLFDWITLPEHIVRKWREGKILHTQFSDICRIELLYQHGGLWFDATDYLTAPVPQYIMDEPLFIFMAGSKIRGSYALIQSCFIRARKANPVLGIWREANSIYWRHENSKVNYFIHHLLLNLSINSNPIAARGFAAMPRIEQDPTHALWGDHCIDPFDPETFRALTAGAFFQKTNYKDKRLEAIPRGSIAEFIINS